MISDDEIATLLERVADLLEAQGANPFRVRAYRRAAVAVRSLVRPVAEILAAEGRAGLVRLPSIGVRLASTIEEIVHTGRLRLLDRLEGQISPEDQFTTIPGIGEDLAARLHDVLGIDTLEELEVAAHDGRLARVPGFGRRRVQAVRGYLDALLSRSARRRAWSQRHGQLRLGFDYRVPHPDVAALLALDEEYRRRADTDALPRIAPRRFNPEARAWLPVWHVERDGWSFTVMFSNTARAHELGKTHDWVVIYCEHDGHEDQYTVVTERRGALAGQRVIRGREKDCTRYYRAQQVKPEVQAWAHAIYASL
ncbi:helix-hairpin-helix domain-containing protein [Haliangium sp.]|uniref:helix-hairpin-helix domain-containing protein n=1 Tax=Haliangium sp. TaxID=2663208 RepID=UPI003D102566